MIVLDGTIAANPRFSVRATSRGTVIRVVARQGGDVNSGSVLFTIASSGKSLSVASPTAGKVVAVNILVGQEIEVGFQAIEVAPEGYQAVASVAPTLMYRFAGHRPSRIVVKVEGGPAPFECAFISLGLPDSDAGGQSNPQLRCGAPAGAPLFSGLPCLVAATLGAAEDVVLVPVTSVEGLADSGYVTVVSPNGSYERRLVKLGLTDGVNVQVVAGLQAGERLLDPPPSVFSDPIVGAQAGSTRS